MSDTRRRLLEVIRGIPHGRVLTYGQVAELAGLARGHRVAAAALRDCPDDVPWHRVLGKRDARRARIAIVGDAASLQRVLLEKEGVVVDAGGCVLLSRFGLDAGIW